MKKGKEKIHIYLTVPCPSGRVTMASPNVKPRWQSTYSPKPQFLKVDLSQIAELKSSFFSFPMIQSLRFVNSEVETL